MVDMVERVARALYAIRMEVAEGAKLPQYTWETDNNAYREHCLREARAAIEAMRPELLRLVDEFDGRFDYPESVVFAVKEALEAALTPSPPSPALPDAHSSRT